MIDSHVPWPPMGCVHGAVLSAQFACLDRGLIPNNHHRTPSDSTLSSAFSCPFTSLSSFMPQWAKGIVKTLKGFLKMTETRARSPSPAPRNVKRQKLDHLTKESFKNGIFLAPMVRSGACKPSN